MAVGSSLQSGLTQVTSLISDLQSQSPTVTSLTEYIKDVQIIARLYIDENVVSEDIISPLASMLQQMYMGYVVTALQLNQYFSAKRSLRDLTRSVSTEDFIDVNTEIKKFFDKEASLEAGSRFDRIESPREANLGYEKEIRRMPAGKIIEVDIAVPTDGGDVIKFPLTFYVMTVPHVLKQTTLTTFLELNFGTPFFRRLAQAKAGEIRFMKDFIMAFDKIDRHSEALRQTSDRELQALLKTKENRLNQSFKNFLPRMLGFKGGQPRHNLSNSVLVVDKKTFDQSCNTAGIDFDVFNEREMFMKNAFVMITCVIDPMYGMVDMYFNGIKAKGSYTYNMIQETGQSKQGMDIKEVMALFGKGVAPQRF